MTGPIAFMLPKQAEEEKVEVRDASPPDPSFCSRKLLMITFTISVLINLSLGALLGSLWGSRRGFSAGKGAGDAEMIPPRAVCLSCDAEGIELATISSRAADLRVRQLSEGSSLCCHDNAESWQYLTTMTEALTSNATVRTHRPVPSLGERTPSAHMYLAPHPARGLRWTERVGWGLAHVTGNVLYREKWGLLRVPSPGLYAVYSGLTLKNRQPRPGNVEVLHSLLRYHPQLPPQGPPYDSENDFTDGPGYGHQLMLMRKATLPREAETFSFSFLWGVLYLREGDEVRVAVSNATFVYDFWASSFFGLLKVSR